MTKQGLKRQIAVNERYLRFAEKNGFAGQSALLKDRIHELKRRLGALDLPNQPVPLGGHDG